MVAGSGRRDAIALIGALVLVAVPVWIVREIRTSDSPVNTATVYAAYLTAAMLALTLLAFLIPWWWKGRRAAVDQHACADPGPVAVGTGRGDAPAGAGDRRPSGRHWPAPPARTGP